MRHRCAGRKFNRTSAHRNAMFRNLLVALIKHERIETTVAKAKDLRKIAEKFVTLAGEGTLHARRQAFSYLPDKAAVHKLFAEIGPRFKDRKGGYTRVLRTRVRQGDAAQLALIEFVEKEGVAASAPVDTGGKKKKASTPKKEAAKTARSGQPAKEVNTKRRTKKEKE